MNNVMESDFAQFVGLFTQATEKVSRQYMQLPVAGRENPEYRERVYCYELYHQLRLQMENFRYSLGGEIDKSGHPLICGGNLDRVKPDLLVHEPGSMERNLAVIEVKPITGRMPGIAKDLKSLTAFCGEGRYHRAIYVIYGGNEARFDKFRDKITTLKDQHPEDINLCLIDIYLHQKPGQKAEKQ